MEKTSRPRNKLKCYFRVLISVVCLFNEVSCDLGVLYVSKPGEDWTDHFCINYNPNFHKLPEQKDQAISYRLSDLSSDFGCNGTTAYDNVDVRGTMVFVGRGNCTFSEKALIAQSYGAIGVIVVSQKLVPPGASQNSDYDIINITVAVIAQQDFEQILGEGKSVEVLLIAPDTSSFDPCMIVIFILAMFCIIAGGYWSGISRYRKLEKQDIYKKRKKRVQREHRNDEDEEEKEEKEEEEEGPMDLTVPVVVVFFIAVCGFLILLYFFYDQLVYVVIGMFCIASTVSLFYCIQPVWNFIPLSARVPVLEVPYIMKCCSGKKLCSSRPYVKEVILAVLCIGVSIFWGVQRNTSYAWVIQDILGITFCVNMLKTVQMPNLKICVVLMVLLFLYDIFFVFISPLFTSSGESVMVKVATGGSSSTGEQLPIMFKVPKLAASPLSVCDLPYSLLGFGDVIVPGLLISYNHGFDIKAKSRKIYFIASVVAYAVGLTLTYIALFVMQSGQPALLYLVPCTLITTFVIGCIRGEAKLLWSGLTIKEKKCETETKRPSGPVTPKTTDVATADRISVSSLSSSDSENKTLLRK